LNQIVNGVKSASDPFKVGSGVSNLALDEFSLSNSLVINTTVGGGDTSEVFMTKLLLKENSSRARLLTPLPTLNGSLADLTPLTIWFKL
jgi:hypothetical protein